MVRPYVGHLGHERVGTLVDDSMVSELRVKIWVSLNVNHEEVIAVLVETLEEDTVVYDDW